jgi:GAF domain-containing protein
LSVRETMTPPTPREQELQRELQRTYEHLSDITSRLLLANEAAEAALSSHDRTELSQRFLTVAARGTEVRRAAIFLADGGGLSVGATVGLDEDELDVLAASQPDIDACHAALESGQMYVVDPSLLTEDALAASETEDLGAEDEEASESEDGEDGEEAEEAESDDSSESALDDSAGDAAAEEDGEAEADADADGEVEEVDADASPAFFGVYLPVVLDDQAIAVLALGERVGRRRYDHDMLVFLRYVLRNLAGALHRSLLIERDAERLRELDALLRVSRQITSTLDLDAVLRAVVNTVAAVVENNRAEIVLLKGDRPVLRAVSGMTRLDPDQVDLFQLAPVFEYLRLRPERVQISAESLEGDEKPPGADVFAEYFSKQQMRSFMALPLRDDQGLLGFLCIESNQDAWEIEAAEGDALEVLAAQTTVAIRNATLYSEIPLRGVALPMSRLRHALGNLSPRGRVIAGAVAAVALLGVLLPIMPERAGGAAEVRPLRFLGARTPTEGVVGQVLVKGGEEVKRGQPLAVIEDYDLATRVAALQGDVEVTRRSLAEARRRGDEAAWRSEQIRLAALERGLVFERRRERGTLLTAPFDGQVLELDLAQRVGQHLEAGESFCTVAALNRMSADFEVSETQIGRVRVGQRLGLKVMAFPTRMFHGRVTEVGWTGHPTISGEARFVVRAEVENPDRALRPGMTGIGRADVARRSVAGLVMEPVRRAIMLGWW